MPDPLEQLAAAEAADVGAPATSPETPEPAAEAPAEAPPQPWEERGLKTPDDVWKSYTEMERRFRERDDEVGQLRQFQERAMPILEQAARGMQGPQEVPTHLPNGVPILTSEQMQQLREEDPSAYADFAVAYRMFDLEQKFEERMAGVLDQRLSPLEKGHVNRGTQDALDYLNQTFGDDVIHRNGELVADLIRRDRAHYADPENGGRRLAEAVALAEYQRQTGGAPGQPQAASSPRPVHVEGGSGAAPPAAAPETPQDARRVILDELLGQAPQPDRFGSPIGTDYLQ